MEPTYGFPLQIGACGEMTLRVGDARKLLIKVVGTEKVLTQAQIVEKFRAFLLLHLKPGLISIIKEKNISVFDIDEHLEEMSEAVQLKLRTDFEDYGVVLEKFMITTVIKPDDNKDYRRFKELHFRQYADVAEAKLRQQVGIIEQQTKAQQMVIEAEGMARKRSLEGYTYQDERRFDVAEKFAENEATGQLANLGVGVGMIGGIGGAVGGNVGGMVGAALGQAAAPASGGADKCAKCGAALPAGVKFCPECGEKCAPPTPATVVCPGCGKSVQRAKFCPECGCKLGAPVCPKCGQEVVAGTKFCPECGEKMN